MPCRRAVAIARGSVRVVIGTRAAAFAPVRDLGLVAIWDDGDDLHDEPRAPYPHAREVLLMRAHETGCAAVATIANAIFNATGKRFKELPISPEKILRAVQV